MGKKASTELVVRQLEHSLHMTSKEIEGLGRNSAVCDYDLGLLDQTSLKKCLADSLNCLSRKSPASRPKMALLTSWRASCSLMPT